MRFEWDENEVTPEEKLDIEGFLQRVNDLGIDNAFFDEEALVFIDGTHLMIPDKVRVIRD